MLAQGTAQLLASSRFAFALARDKGQFIPSSSSRVDVDPVPSCTVQSLHIPSLPQDRCPVRCSLDRGRPLHTRLAVDRRKF